MMNNSGSGLISELVLKKFGTYLFNTTIVTVVAVLFQLFKAALFHLVGELGWRNSYAVLIVLQIGIVFGIFLVCKYI